MPTIIDVAEKAGVSKSTVSRVLTNSQQVDPKTKQKVFAAIQALKYQPRRAAQSLRNKKTMLLAVLVPRISNPFFSELLQVLESKAAEYQYSVLLCNTDYNAEKEMFFLQMLQNGQVDGIIMTAYHNKIEVIRPFKEFGPVIFAGEYAKENTFPTASINHLTASYRITEHFIRLGHQDIGMVNGSLASIIPRDREKGFRIAMEKYGIPVHEKWVKAFSFGISEGRAYIRNLCKIGTIPTAIFAANDELAVGVIQEAKAQGMKIPGDIAVGGFDDQPMATVIEPKLTTIRQPINRLGTKAVELMMQSFNGEKTESEVMEAQLIVRKSCGAYIANK